MSVALTKVTSIEDDVYNIISLAMVDSTISNDDS